MHVKKKIRLNSSLGGLFSKIWISFFLHICMFCIFHIIVCFQFSMVCIFYTSWLHIFANLAYFPTSACLFDWISQLARVKSFIQVSTRLFSQWVSELLTWVDYDQSRDHKNIAYDIYKITYNCYKNTNYLSTISS